MAIVRGQMKTAARYLIMLATELYASRVIIVYGRFAMTFFAPVAWFQTNCHSHHRLRKLSRSRGCRAIARIIRSQQVVNS